MSAAAKDSAEVINFMMLFKKLRDWRSSCWEQAGAGSDQRACMLRRR